MKSKLIIIGGSFIVISSILWYLDIISEPLVAIISAIISLAISFIKDNQDEKNSKKKSRFRFNKKVDQFNSGSGDNIKGSKILNYYNDWRIILIICISFVLVLTILYNSNSKKIVTQSPQQIIYDGKIIDRISDTGISNALIEISIPNQLEKIARYTDIDGNFSFSLIDTISNNLKVEVSKDSFIPITINLNSLYLNNKIWLDRITEDTIDTYTIFKRRAELQSKSKFDLFNFKKINDEIHSIGIKIGYNNSNNYLIQHIKSTNKGISWTVQESKIMPYPKDDESIWIVEEYLYTTINEINHKNLLFIHYQDGGRIGGTHIMHTYDLKSLNYLGSVRISGDWSFSDDIKYDPNRTNIEYWPGEYNKYEIKNITQDYINTELFDYSVSLEKNENDYQAALDPVLWRKSNPHFFSLNSGYIENSKIDIIPENFNTNFESNYSIENNFIYIYKNENCLYARDKTKNNKYILMCYGGFKNDWRMGSQYSLELINDSICVYYDYNFDYSKFERKIIFEFKNEKTYFKTSRN